jgi:surface-anchored protein
MVVKADARTAIPNNRQFAFLGDAGSPIWVLPQVQNPALLWPGLNSQEIEAGAIAGNSLTLALVAAHGPAPFALFSTDQFGTPSVLFNSGDGLPDSIDLPIGTHAHGNWSFRAPGRYALTFQASGRLASGEPLVATATLAFEVEGASSSLAPTIAAASEPVTPPRPPSTGGDPSLPTETETDADGGRSEAGQTLELGLLLAVVAIAIAVIGVAALAWWRSRQFR